MKILQINSSARSAGANSTRLADAITVRLKAANPAAVVELRDLAANPHPVLDEAALGALFTPAEQRTPEQAARVARNGGSLHRDKVSIGPYGFIALAIDTEGNMFGLHSMKRNTILVKGLECATKIWKRNTSSAWSNTTRSSLRRD